MEYVSRFLSQDPMHLEYENYIQRKCGNSIPISKISHIQRKCVQNGKI